MTNEPTFTLAEVLKAQKALRNAAGAEEEELDLTDLAGIAGDELDMLQDQEKSWDEMAAIIRSATGKPVTGEELEKAYRVLDEIESWADDDGKFNGEGDR